MQATNGRTTFLPTQQLPAVQPVWNYLAWFVIVFSVCLIVFVVMPAIREVTASLKGVQESLDKREIARNQEEAGRERVMKSAREAAIVNQSELLRQQRQMKELAGELTFSLKELRDTLKKGTP